MLASCIGGVTWQGFEPKRLMSTSAALPDRPHSARRASLIRRDKLQITPPMGTLANADVRSCCEQILLHWLRPAPLKTRTNCRLDNPGVLFKLWATLRHRRYRAPKSGGMSL